MQHGQEVASLSRSTHESPGAHVVSYLSSAASVITRLPTAEITKVIEVLEAIRIRGRTVWTFGNGGNATIASHLSLGLSLNARRTGGTPLRALCLTSDSAQVTAAINDFGQAEPIAAQLAIFARPGDAAVALSASGESPNVLRALEVAKEIGVTTIGLVGRPDSPVGQLCRYTVNLGSSEPGLAEDAAQVVAHAIYCWFMRNSNLQEPITQPEQQPAATDSEANTSDDEV